MTIRGDHAVCKGTSCRRNIVYIAVDGKRIPIDPVRVRIYQFDKANYLDKLLELGLKVTATTSPVCPTRCPSCSPVLTFHNVTVCFSEANATQVPSGLKVAAPKCL